MLASVLAVVGWIGFAWALTRARRRPAPSTETPRQAVVPNIPFTEALASIDIGVVIADDDGAIVYRNSKAETPSGAMHSDLLIDEAVERHVRSAIGGQTSRQTLDLYGPPRRVISVQASPLAKGGAVIVIEDATEQALVDAVRTDFVANISHELKTPVGALSVLAEALSQVDDPETVHRLSSKIADEAIRVGRTIDDLLELSRIEFGGKAVMDVVDVDNVMAEAIGRTQAFAESRSILVGCDQQRESGLQVLGDRRQLVSALGNLIENAVKYSEEGGRVTLSARRQGTAVEMSVRDFGMGIPAKDIDRIFERFYRVDRARSRETGGTGLGLAIVRHVATNHGGRVFVESREGEGSIFTLALPDAQGLRDGGER